MDREFDARAYDQGYRDGRNEAAAEIGRLRAALERTIALAELVTVKQVIDAGDEVIEAAGLNPWCIAEGLADGSEPVSLWWAYSALGGDT